MKLAIATKQSNILSTVLQDLDRLSHLWGVSEAEKQNIHQSLHQLLAESDPWLSHVHMLKWLEAFKTEAECASKIAEITAAVTQSIALPFVFQYQSLVNSPAAAAVAKTNPDLVRLAKILINGSFKDFVAFSKASPGVFTGPISMEAIATKMRILSIVSLANSSTNISYQKIADEIEVPLEDAETWVLDAVAEGLLEAKLDHLSSSIYVTYAFRREFGMDQWKDLQDKLGKWMDNIQGMITVIRDARTHGKEGQHTALKQGLVGSSQ